MGEKSNENARKLEQDLLNKQKEVSVLTDDNFFLKKLIKDQEEEKSEEIKKLKDSRDTIENHLKTL